MNIVKSFNSLPPIAKGIIAIITVGVTGVIVIKTIKAIKRRMQEGDFKDTVNAADRELKQLLTTQQPSYADSVYSGWANSINSKLSGCDFNSNDAAVLVILSNIKNDVDWLKLVKAYGVKTVEGCSPSWTGVGNYTSDLPTLLNKELTTVNALKVNTFFEKHGMKSRI